MAALYKVSYTGTVTNAGGNADLLELTPGDDAPIRLYKLIIGFTSEVGDAQEEGVSLSLIYLPATVTSSNGTAVTPARSDQRIAAAIFAAEANGATVATTSGTAITLEELSANVRIATEWVWPTVEEQIVIRQGAALVLRNNTTLADDATVTITAYVYED